MASLKNIPWPSMRGNTRNTGYRVFKWETQPQPVRWVDSSKYSPSNLSLINATPIVGADETIYVGSSNGIFYAFTKDDSVYILPTGDIVDSAACFTDDARLFFPSGGYRLYSIEHLPPPPKLDGIPHPLPNNVDSVSTINWLEGNVVTDESANSLYAGCDNFFLFCCDPNDSKEFVRWAFPTGFFIWSACAFAGDQRTLYFVSADMVCYALDPATGQQRWQREIGNLCASSPAVSQKNQVIFGAFDGDIYCLDAASGKELWKYKTGSVIYASAALSEADNRIFVLSSDGVMRALEASAAGVEGAKLLWEFFTGMPGFSSAAIGPDPEGKDPYLIYVGSGDGYIYALTPQGLRRWSYDIAALYVNEAGPNGSDPAFWRSFRYPAVNSSIALGNQGVVTASSGGMILSIAYDAYLRDNSRFFNRSPQDNYSDQIQGSEIRLCYISPAGRMAGKVLPLQSTGAELAIGQQTISFAALSRRSNDAGSTRSSFTALSPRTQVLVDGVLYRDWTLSADQTQLNITSPSVWEENKNDFNLTIKSEQGAVLGAAQCVYQAVPQPLSNSDILNASYSIQQMSVYVPFIVPALDQLGISVIKIYLRFLSIDDKTGEAAAYAYESYDPGASGAPIRNLIYLFAGVYKNGNLRLTSGPCYFELTGFPAQLDSLAFSGALGEKSCDGISLTASYHSSIGKTIEWLITYLMHWVNWKSFLPSWKDFNPEAVFKELQNLAAGPAGALSRWARFLVRVLLSFFGGTSVFTPWKLFNRSNEMFWTGTYSLFRQPQPAWPAAKASFSYGPIAQLTVTVALAKEYVNPPVLGIILLDKDSKPVALNYTDQNSAPTYGSDKKTITQTLSLLGSGLDANAKFTAVAMVDLGEAEPRYEFSPTWI